MRKIMESTVIADSASLAPPLRRNSRDFQAYQRRKGKAAGTVKQYGQYLRPFVAWVGPRDWSDITADADRERMARALG